MKIVSCELPYQQKVEDFLRQQYPTLREYRILSQSLDARGANRGRVPRFLYQIALYLADEPGPGPMDLVPPQDIPMGELKDLQQNRPLIVGAGPAGLFCALKLLDYGISSQIFERGDRAEDRMLKIARFWRYGEFDPESNVCYGEGGAGLFSDGKLLTRVKSPHIAYVMKRFVDFGAPEHIQWTSDPHLGSNKIRKLISGISQYLLAKGCQIHYRAKVDEILFTPGGYNEKPQVQGIRLQDGRTFSSPYLVLAMGHSAKNIYEFLHESKVALRPKSFAMGLRIEHPREQMDELQYGPFAGDPVLGTAKYSVRHTDKKTGRGAYSFCMCPGGYVLSSGTEANGLVVNGMSNYSRHSPWSNSALVVTVKAGEDFAQNPSDPEEALAGLKWQLSLEHEAWKMSQGKAIPAQGVMDYLKGKITQAPLPKTSCPSGIVPAPLHQLYPKYLYEHLCSSLEVFNRQIPGMISKAALLLAPETRTSSPLTVVRDEETLESISHKNLYPCGEGAGYAGGITSAAVDGIRVAERLVLQGR